jgi:hypothetical protein
MATSINGWPVLVRGSHDLHTYTIPGVPDRRLTLAKGAAPILLYVAGWYHTNVHALNRENHHHSNRVDEGGYNFRKSRVSTRWSNHSSGTAIDLDWAREGAQSTWARRWWAQHKAQKAAVEGLLKELDGAVTWGGDWHGRYQDFMHFEISKGWDAHHLLMLQRKLGINGDGARG